jgi:hypothetical protein
MRAVGEMYLATPQESKPYGGVSHVKTATMDEISGWISGHQGVQLLVIRVK